MSTAAQIRANRRNAQHSSGPTSAIGKSTSSQNNFRHGLRGKFTLLADEDPKEFSALMEALHDEHKPVTITEQLLAERMAEQEWLSRRAQTLVDQALLAEAEDDPKLLTIWLRYRTTHDRGFHKCLADLLRLKSEKRKERIGFERQQRAATEQTRKQNLNEARTRALHAQAAVKELDVEFKCMLQAPLPGHTVIDFEEIKPFLNQAIKHYFQSQALSATQ